eukprot:COSAG04_NODE_18374_length_443_cov_2.304428_1_plen_54_part_10
MLLPKRENECNFAALRVNSPRPRPPAAASQRSGTAPMRPGEGGGAKAAAPGFLR